MKEFNKVLKQIENVYNLNLEIGEKLFEQKRYEYSDIFIINENEMNNKIKFIKNILTIKNNALNENYIEKSYKFEESNLNNFYNFIEQKHKEIPNLWIKSATVWGMKKTHTKKEKDVFGFCYNNLVEYVFNTIINFDFNEFSKFYKEIFGLSVLSETIIHEDIENDNNISESYKFQFQMSGLYSMFELSGYAILVGEILKDKRWLETTRTIVKNFFDKLDEEKCNIIFDKWIKIIELDEGNIFQFDCMKLINLSQKGLLSKGLEEENEKERVKLFKTSKEFYWDARDNLSKYLNSPYILYREVKRYLKLINILERGIIKINKWKQK